VSSFPAKFNRERQEREPNEEGISPLNPLFDKSKQIRDSKFEKLEGSTPTERKKERIEHNKLE